MSPASVIGAGVIQALKHRDAPFARRPLGTARVGENASLRNWERLVYNALQSP
jgi:hypothetical protein